MAKVEELPDNEQKIVFQYIFAETQKKKDVLIENFDQEKRLRILSAASDYNLRRYNEVEASDEEDYWNKF